MRGAVEQADPLQRGGHHTAVTSVDGVVVPVVAGLVAVNDPVAADGNGPGVPAARAARRVPRRLSAHGPVHVDNSGAGRGAAALPAAAGRGVDGSRVRSVSRPTTRVRSLAA